MALSNRNRAKHVKKAATMLPPGTEPVSYTLGGGGEWPPRLTGWAVGGVWLAVTITISALLQTPVIIGALPMLAVYFWLNKPRGIVLAKQGVASMRCGFLNGRPTHVIAIDAPGALNNVTKKMGNATQLRIGTDHVWITDADLQMFHRLQGAPSSPPPPS